MNSMYCAEQIQIPRELGTILKQYTKAVITEQPSDLYKWSANYFAILSNQATPFDEQGQLRSQQAPRSSNTADGPMVTDVLTDAAGYESVPTTDEESHAIVDHIFTQYDPRGTGRLNKKVLPSLIGDLKASLGLDLSDEQTHELSELVEPDEDGTIDLVEFRQLFFQSE